jgi:hypothetical protein
MGLMFLTLPLDEYGSLMEREFVGKIGGVLTPWPFVHQSHERFYDSNQASD